MKKLLLGAILLFSVLSYSASNEKNKKKKVNSTTYYSSSSSDVQYKKYRKQRSDKGKKRGSYKKRK